MVHYHVVVPLNILLYSLNEFERTKGYIPDVDPLYGFNRVSVLECHLVWLENQA